MGVVAVYFVPQSQFSGRYSIYKALILDNKQLLSNRVDREATQVPYTIRNAFFADSYIFYLNFPSIFVLLL